MYGAGVCAVWMRLACPNVGCFLFCFFVSQLNFEGGLALSTQRRPGRTALLYRCSTDFLAAAVDVEIASVPLCTERQVEQAQHGGPIEGVCI